LNFHDITILISHFPKPPFCGSMLILSSVIRGLIAALHLSYINYYFSNAHKNVFIKLILSKSEYHYPILRLITWFSLVRCAK